MASDSRTSPANRPRSREKSGLESHSFGQGVETDLKQIVDVAPTFLYSQGLSIPSDFEGSVPQDFFTEEYWNSLSPQTGPETLSIEQLNTSSSPSSSSDDATEEDKQKIIAQLQMLGYME